MVDEKKIAIKLAVEIAELSESEQQEILDYFNLGYKVSLEQVKAIKNKEKSTSLKDWKRKLSRVQRLQYPGRNLSSIFLKIIQRQKWRT